MNPSPSSTDTHSLPDSSTPPVSEGAAASLPNPPTSQPNSDAVQVLADTAIGQPEAVDELQVLAGAPSEARDSATANPAASPPIVASRAQRAHQRQKLWVGALGLGAASCVALAMWSQRPAPPIAPVPTVASATGTNAPRDVPVFVAPSVQPDQNPKGSLGVPRFGLPKGNAPATGNGNPSPIAPRTTLKAPDAQTSQLFEQAVALQKAGDVAGATQKYRELLQKRPKTLEARSNLAILFAQNKQPQKALEQLQEARKINSNNPAINWQLAQLALSLKKFDTAIEPLRDVVRADPKNVQAQVLVAQVWGELKRPREAFKAWQVVSRSTPKDGQAALAAGTIAFEMLKEPGEAEPWLRRALSLPPADPREPLLLGRALMARKKAGEAAKILVPAARQWKDVPEITLLLADARAASGDAKGAAGAIRSVLTKVPESRDNGVPAGQLRLQLGRLLASQARSQSSWKGAQKELEHAARLLPKDADLRAMLADVSVRAGDVQGAVSHLRVLMTLDAKRSGVRIAIARIFAQTNRLEDAESEYRKYLQARPKDAAVIAERAVLLEKMNRIDDALSAWKTLGAVLPDNPMPSLQKGRVLRAAKREEAALDAFRYVLQTWPNDPHALLNVAELESKSGQHARALSRWKALISTKPAFEPAYGNLLESARLSGQLDATTNFLKNQLAKNPARPAAYVALLTVYKRANRGSDGRAIVDNLARLYPRAKAPRLALQAFDEGNPVPTPQSTEPALAPSSTPSG